MRGTGPREVATLGSGAGVPRRVLANILTLGGCQAFFFMANTITISTSPLVGLQYAPTPALATLPFGLQFLATMATTIPASFLMREIGRRGGFLLGGSFCLASGLLAAWAIRRGDFLLFCLASALYGVFSAFAQYYRFAAADAAELAGTAQPAALRARAVSWVLAGGIVAGVLGPELAKATRELFPPYVFLGSYLAVAGLGAATVVVVSALAIPRPDGDGPRPAGRPLLQILKTPGALTAVLAAISAYVTMNLLMTATPLAMMACGHGFGDTARVLQAHVVGMFGPSFFTGSLIARWGARRVVLAGVGLMLLCVAVAVSGVEVERFALALFALGVGWNFMFIGGTTLLTSCHRPEEKAKVQGFNDFLLFTSVSLSATGAGALHGLLGWQTLNLLALPLLALVAVVALAAERRGPAVAGGAS